jgi:hypothetical protein
MIQSETKPIERIASPPIVPEGPVIDLAHLARMTLGDKRLEAEVLALLDRQADLLLARMREALPAAAGAFAHTLKGSARGVGAWRVAAAAERVEVAAGGDGSRRDCRPCGCRHAGAGSHRRPPRNLLTDARGRSSGARPSEPL